MLGCLGEALQVGWIRGWQPRGGKKGWVDPRLGACGWHFGLGASDVACLWEALWVGWIRCGVPREQAQTTRALTPRWDQGAFGFRC